MFSNLKTALKKITSKTEEEEEYKGEDIQAVIILLIDCLLYTSDAADE